MVASNRSVGERKTTVRMAKRGPTTRASRWHLLGVAGKSAGQSFLLQPGETVVGRDPSAGLRLQDSGVSREHARLVFSDDGRLLVCDLDSTNGTFLKLEGELELRSGDVFAVGRQLFRFLA